MGNAILAFLSAAVAWGFYGYVIVDIYRRPRPGETTRNQVELTFLVSLWIICAVVFGILIGIRLG